MGKPDPNAPLWGHMERTLHRGEVPRTKFLDMEDAKKVTVLKWPGMHDGMIPAGGVPFNSDANTVVSFAKTCHAPEPMDVAPHETLAGVMEAAAGGSLLWQVAETLHYVLRLEGLTRILSHQLVRARVGWTFSETCTGDHDWRHGDFLVPRAWRHSSVLLERRLHHLLLSKGYYAAAVDGHCHFDLYERPSLDAVGRSEYQSSYCEVPNDARYGLHPNLKVFVHASTNLAALKEWYAKRSCTMTQAWEMVVLAERVKAAVLAVTPWAAPAFECPCNRGQCWYLKAYKQPLAMANYYQPDAIHAAFMDDWNPRSFLSDKTHYEVSSGPTPFSTREYVGYDRIS